MHIYIYITISNFVRYVRALKATPVGRSVYALFWRVFDTRGKLQNNYRKPSTNMMLDKIRQIVAGYRSSRSVLHASSGCDEPIPDSCIDIRAILAFVFYRRNIVDNWPKFITQNAYLAFFFHLWYISTEEMEIDMCSLINFLSISP